ncbi:unnamed protein product [Trypanosoma congolense IL3000]|uniref:WGS project CAEQ00000000 data, annotated contig 849 n=1 Tax=Trypanosoma congolense (strain IL3000) TaxID=1068625 RepID=F9WIY6_TRYCI|nr:unnamed protein product [Trypanosoma congolense IL3000]
MKGSQTTLSPATGTLVLQPPTCQARKGTVLNVVVEEQKVQDREYIDVTSQSSQASRPSQVNQVGVEGGREPIYISSTESTQPDPHNHGGEPVTYIDISSEEWPGLPFPYCSRKCTEALPLLQPEPLGPLLAGIQCSIYKCICAFRLCFLELAARVDLAAWFLPTHRYTPLFPYFFLAL